MKRILIMIGSLALLCGAGAVGYVFWPRHHAYYSDADTIRESAEVATIREILWKPPVALPDIINTIADDYEPRLTPDGQTMYFVRGKPGSNADIFVSRRTPDGWSPAEALIELNSGDDDLGPELSPDGKSLYFYSDRPGGIGGYDLWVSRRGPDGWQTPTNLGSHVNSEFNDYGPALSPDGKTFAFSSNRPREPRETPKPTSAWQATLREDPYRHDYDLFVAAISDAGMALAQPVNRLNTPQNDGSPAFSPVGDFLYFASDRTGGCGGYDIYRARRVRGDFEAPQGLGASVNSAANELDPALEMGGYALHFSSDRAKQGASPAASLAKPDYDIYRSVSREVFREVEVQHARIDWAALWNQIGPNLLMALLALLLLALLLALLRDFKNRKLSLLARCLLASLMVHLLLMLLFNVVEVTTSLASAFRKSNRLQVSLVSPAMAGELAIQVRGDLTSVDIQTPEAPELARRDVFVETPRETTIAEVNVESTPMSIMDSPSIKASPVESSARSVEVPRPTAIEPPAPASSFEVDAPVDVARLQAEEAREEIVPREADFARINRATTPLPTTQPASDAVPVELRPDASNTSSLSDASQRMSDPQISDAPARLVTPASLPRSRVSGVPANVPQIENLPTDHAPQVTRTESTPGMFARLPSQEAPQLPRAAVLTDTNVGIPALSSLTPESKADESPPSSLMDAAATSPIESSPGADAKTDIADRANSREIPLAPVIDVTLPAERHAVAEASTHEETSRITATVPPIADLRGNLQTQSDSPMPQVVSIAPDSASPTTDRHESLMDVATVAQTSESPNPKVETASPGTSLPRSFGAVDLDLGLPSEIAAPAKPADGAIGIIRGLVTDAWARRPLPGVKIQLDLPNQETVIVLTDSEGRYSLHAPQVPDHFALTASKSGYLPQSLNVPSSRLKGRTLDVDFSLQPASELVIALEKDPAVHHLGNDLFEGRINSQFQRESEGTRYRATFSISADQLAPNFKKARVELMAKGVQCPHQIRINSRRLERRLGNSPADGSFGRYSTEFDASILKPGRNTLVLRNVTCRDDIDDFEFVNIQIRLLPDEPIDAAPSAATE